MGHQVCWAGSGRLCELPGVQRPEGDAEPVGGRGQKRRMGTRRVSAWGAQGQGKRMTRTGAALALPGYGRKR